VAGLRKILAGEQALSEGALLRRPKSYLAWLHRRWIVALSHCGPGGMAGRPCAALASDSEVAMDLSGELALCARFLDKDQRNFHCHNYRRWLLTWVDLPPAEDLAFTKAQLAKNPANYSAWHQRALALSKVPCGRGSGEAEGSSPSLET
jgi:geranylgeranyl transferase type-2 subunit alpha